MPIVIFGTARMVTESGRGQRCFMPGELVTTVALTLFMLACSVLLTVGFHN